MTLTPLAATAIDVLGRFPTGMELIRSTPGSYVGGRWQDGEPAVGVPLAGTIHDAKGTDLEHLPEELRRSRMAIVHTRTALTAIGSDQTPDRIRWKGDVWEVVMLRDRAEGGFFRAIVGIVKDVSNVVGNADDV